MSTLEGATTGLGCLAETALELLPEMLQREPMLFSHKISRDRGRYRNIGSNINYSSVALAGLLSQRRLPPEGLIPLDQVVDGVFRAVEQHGGSLELANLVWVATLLEHPSGERLLARLLTTDLLAGNSTELGQVLFGLTAGGRTYPGLRDRAHRGALDCVRELVSRFAPEGDVFRPMGRIRAPRRGLREVWIASFADQVYPLHGLAAFHAWTDQAPAHMLTRVAERLVASQGDLGQWWWLYATHSRTILEGYPVYSVHQDGMAFLALVALERLGLGRYSEALNRGLEWMFGANELGADMVHGKPPFINRCIQRAGSDPDAPYGVSAASLWRVIGRSAVPRWLQDRTAADPARLEVLRECRSYHLGWILYADSLVQPLPRADPRGG